MATTRRLQFSSHRPHDMAIAQRSLVLAHVKLSFLFNTDIVSFLIELFLLRNLERSTSSSWEMNNSAVIRHAPGEFSLIPHAKFRQQRTGQELIFMRPDESSFQAIEDFPAVQEFA